MELKKYNTNLSMKEVVTTNVYKLLKRRIEKQTYDTKEEMQQMLDDYRYAKRITSEQYRELTDLLAQE